MVSHLVDRAGQAYVKTAQCESDEAISASYYVEAANCTKKVNTSEAVKLMEQAIDMYCATGGIHMVLPYPSI